MRSEAKPESHHVYALDGGGYDRARATHAVLCDLRDALKATPNNPVSDVVIFACGKQNSQLPTLLFQQLELQRPAGANALYVAVEWPCFVASQPVPAKETGQGRFKRLMDDIRATYLSGGADENTEVLDNLVSKCERYMEDVDRLVKYGKKGDERFPADLRDQLVQMSLAFGRQGTRCAPETEDCSDMKPFIDGGRGHNGVLTSIQVDDLQRAALKSSEIEDTLSNGMADTVSLRPTERHWLVLCRVIATVMSRALERRAALVGQRGVHGLICDLMRHTTWSTRFHLAAHAHGAHAALSSTLGPGLPRRLHTLYVAQGACEAGVAGPRMAYRPLSNDWRPVAGALICVAAPTSMLPGHPTLDEPYSLAAHGWRGVSCKGLVVRSDKQTKVHYRPGGFYTLHAEQLDGEEQGDMCANAELVALFWEAVMTKLPANAYGIVDPATLPGKYWTSYRSRTRRWPVIHCSSSCLC